MRTMLAALALLLMLPFEARADDPVLAFMRHVDAQAKADMAKFQWTVSAQFGVPEVQVEAVLGQVHDPGDAFMVFQLGQWSRQPADRVVPVYQAHKSKGWGALAKELGIKPGSPEFHALKRGDLHYGNEGGDEQGHGHGHGQGKGHGHGKGEGGDEDD